MCFVYVLRSLKNKKRYTGITSQTVSERLLEHNNGKNVYTRLNRPYELVYFEKVEDKKAALRREKFLKTGQGREFLDKVVPAFPPQGVAGPP